MSFLRAHRQFAIYLFLLSLFGMVLTYLVTFRFGPGLSTDGARYLATAQSLLNGKGFYDYLNQPLTQFPPLYSIFIALISLASRLDVFVAAQYFNILTFGLVIWLAGYFFYRIFPDQPLFHYFGSAVFATSLSLLIMASNVLSDLLFLAFTIAFLIAATDMLEKGSTKSILVLGVLAGLSTFQRYAGLALIITGSILILFLYRKRWLRGILYAGLFGALTALPILLWVYFHNYLSTGILFGVRMPPVYLGNLQVTVEKAVHWFLPVSVTNRLPLWSLALIVFLLLVTGNRPVDWKRWFKLLFTPPFLPSLVFVFIYLGILVFNVSYYEVRWPFMDRIHIIMLPALLALMFLTIRELTPFYLRNRSPRAVRVIAIAAFLLWLSFPLYNLQKYVTRAYSQGETSEYNMYNIPILRESGIKDYFHAQLVDPNQKIYSNYEAAAWFLTRRAITKLPYGDVTEKRVKPEEVLKRFPAWPGRDGNGYVIWIDELSFKPYVLSPEQLAGRADFQLVYWSKGGEIYLLTPK
jgi:hypothetical protein